MLKAFLECLVSARVWTFTIYNMDSQSLLIYIACNLRNLNPKTCYEVAHVGMFLKLGTLNNYQPYSWL